MIKNQYFLFFSLILLSTGCAAASGPLGIGILSVVIISLAVFSSACENDSPAKSSYGIFITAETTDGQIGANDGKASADAMCNDISDTNHPNNGSTFKALIGASDRNLTTDWVLKASTEYTRFDIDSTVIGSTDADAKLITPLDSSFEQNGQYAWTGLNYTFTVSSNCGDWEYNDSTYSGTYGYTGYITYGAWFRNTGNCDNEYAIICVEQ